MIEALESRRLLAGGPIVTRFVITPRTPDGTTVNGTVVFSVTYQDPDGVDPTSITNRNLRIAGPNGFARYARAESSFANADGTIRTVRYKISSPGPRWLPAQNGVYGVTLHGFSMSDNLGNFSDFKRLGSFRVVSGGVGVPIGGAWFVINFYDIAYGTGVAIASPYWLVRSATRRKVLRAFRERMGHVDARPGDAPAVLIHAVSLGEVNAARALVDLLLARRDDLQIIVSTTTDTGFDRGQQLFGSNPRVRLIRYPLDFTSAIVRALDALRPGAVVLMELEIWPNFVRECARRNIPVMLANGRLTEESFRRYRLIRPVAAKMLRRVARVCAQDQHYAERFLALGAPRDRVSVTGTMKFDTATIADRVDGADELAASVALQPGRKPIWVCGSTGPGEEEIVLRVYRALLKSFPKLRIVIVPRKPERFDEVAKLIESSGFALVRRSNPTASADRAVVLGDTMGELRKFYALADLVFVGRTLVDLGPRQHGSDMIEPAALGKAVIVGPFTGNFSEVMRRFLSSEAIVQVPDEATLAATLAALLKNPDEAGALGARAQRAVKAGQGATQQHAEIVLQLLAQSGQSR